MRNSKITFIHSQRSELYQNSSTPLTPLNSMEKGKTNKLNQKRRIEFFSQY